MYGFKAVGEKVVNAALFGLRLHGEWQTAIDQKALLEMVRKSNRLQRATIREYRSILAVSLAKSGKTQDSKSVINTINLDAPVDEASHFAIEEVLVQRLRVAMAQEEKAAICSESQRLYSAIAKGRARAKYDDIDHMILADLAIALKQCGQSDGAKAIAHIIIADTPDVPLPRNQWVLGVAYFAIGDGDKASSHFKSGQILGPEIHLYSPEQSNAK